jgi:hypothetical protein
MGLEPPDHTPAAPLPLASFAFLLLHPALTPVRSRLIRAACAARGTTGILKKFWVRLGHDFQR